MSTKDIQKHINTHYNLERTNILLFEAQGSVSQKETSGESSTNKYQINIVMEAVTILFDNPDLVMKTSSSQVT